MLDLAYKHEQEIRDLFYDTWYDEKYMFYHISYRTPFQTSSFNDGDWNCRQLASVDSNGNVIGYISYSIIRQSDIACEFGAINFSDNKLTFGRDLIQVIDDIFCKFNLKKLEFSVIVGNPIEKTYDAMIKKYNGNIVGIQKRHAKLMDNNYYDQKLYEIFREDYITAKENRHGKRNNSSSL